MKLLVLTVLLLTVCSLEGAVVRRQAEESTLQSLLDQVDQYFQTVAEYGKEIIDKVKVQDLREQTRSYLMDTQKSLSPLVKNAQSELMSFLGFFVELKPQSDAQSPPADP